MGSGNRTQGERRGRGRRGNRTNRRRGRFWSIGPGALALGGAIVLLLVGFLFILAQDRPAPPASDALDVQDERGIPYPEVPRSPVSEAWDRYDGGTAIFVDVRTKGEYDTAHIPNAISVPLADLEARYRELPQDAEIITY